MHTVKTTIVTSATGEITGFGFCVEAEHSGDPAEIAACITSSLDMLRATISASFTLPAAQLAGDPPAGYAPAQPPADPQPPSTGVLHTPHFPPATAAEAEQRFYTRYGEIIGGANWADVQRYLRQPRRLAPTNVAGWIALAETVRDRSRAT